MFSEHPKRIEYYHHARRYLRERDPVAYETASVKEIEHVADMLRYEAFRENIQPYLKHKERLIGDFYSLQTRPDMPMPDWLREDLAEWDSMIASVAREFGFVPPESEIDGAQF
jgi:hypothetical protein